MIGNMIKAAAISSLVVLSSSALAQTSGNSGNLGSAALGIDFFAGAAAGANYENVGGLASSIEAAFGGGTQQRPESGERE
jgi:hypothetical protein